MQIDYARYAAGEAELGWLNGTARLESDGAWELDSLLLDYVTHLQRWLAAADAEIAHLKVLGMAEGKTSVVNAVHSGTPCEISVASRVEASAADLIINARVAIDPEALATLVTNELHRVCHARNIQAVVHDLQRFRPAAPVPTHGREDRT